MVLSTKCLGPLCLLQYSALHQIPAAQKPFVILNSGANKGGWCSVCQASMQVTSQQLVLLLLLHTTTTFTATTTTTITTSIKSARLSSLYATNIPLVVGVQATKGSRGGGHWFRIKNNIIGIVWPDTLEIMPLPKLAVLPRQHCRLNICCYG